MRTTRLTALALTSLLALGAVATPAMADDHDRDHRGHDNRGHDDRGRGHDDRRDDRHDNHHDNHDRREAYRDGYQDGRRYDNHRPAVVYRPAPRPVYHQAYYRPGPPPSRYYGWAPGHRYRDYYGGPVYVVNDYGRYHVRRPPYGYHWVRDDAGNLLMVAIASGIIADLVFHH